MPLVPHTDADEREVLAWVVEIEQALFRQLLLHPRIPADSPRFGRKLAIHAVTDLLTRLMLSDIAMDPDPQDARTSNLALVHALEGKLVPKKEYFQ
jgi:hypothetical protein